MKTETPQITHLLRCESLHFEGGRVDVITMAYPITKTTGRGWWIDVHGRRRWVSASGKKRFALPTQEEAVTSFQARKRRQIAILTAQLARARKCLDVKPRSHQSLSGLEF